MKSDKIYNILKDISDQNIKPHMAYLILKMHTDMDFHNGIELVKRGYDVAEVYDTIEILVSKKCLTRFGKKTKITKKGIKILSFVDETINTLNKMIIK